jgi:hypothetical protein
MPDRGGFGIDPKLPGSFSELYAQEGIEWSVNQEGKIKAGVPTIIYTDGAFTPRKSTEGEEEEDRAGVGVYFGDGDIRNVSARLEGEQNNNRAELTALEMALDGCSTNEPVLIFSGGEGHAKAGAPGVHHP